MSVSCDVVVPSAGRPSLRRLLEALAAGGTAGDGQVIAVDDRQPGAERALLQGPLPDGLRVRVVRGRGGGPAAARNRGWLVGRAEWVAFLDDDVVPEPGWRRALAPGLLAISAEQVLGAFALLPAAAGE